MKQNLLLTSMIYRCLLIFSIFLTTACSTVNSPSLSPAFYYWRSEFKLSALEKQAIEEVKAQKLYVHFFDVVWDDTAKMPVPLASLTGDSANLPHVQVVPTVFITNVCLEKCPDSTAEQLAPKICKKIEAIAKRQGINSISEIQLDCDWSEGTRAKYFQLVENIKKNYPSPIQISATIRLHQVKYFKKTGVPPVDRGMLMFYNMSDVRNNRVENSILDLKEAEKYMVNFEKYPLKLDIALPIFSWGAVNRYGKLVHLLSDFRLTAENQPHLKQIAENQYQVTQSYYENGVYLYTDDLIRVEKVSSQALAQSKDLLLKHLNNQDITISFYHLSENNLAEHSAKELLEVIK